ncbi:MAG TPA: hypothetical protein VFV41_27125, partial [Streptosporangiaceae bacterium]|nr:hypothetical protein [Streptosporangiaceae bacterium]
SRSACSESTGHSSRLRGRPAQRPGPAAHVHTGGLSRVRGTIAATSSTDDLAVNMDSSGNPG